MRKVNSKNRIMHLLEVYENDDSFVERTHVSERDVFEMNKELLA